MKEVKQFSIGNGKGGSWTITAYDEQEALLIFSSMPFTKHLTPSHIREVQPVADQKCLEAMRSGEYHLIKTYGGIN